MAPTDVVDIEFTAPFNAAFDSMRTAIKKAVDGFNTLVGRVNDYRWLLGPVAMWWVKKNLETARDVLTKIIDMVQHAFEHQIPVLSLIYTSFKWIDTVKKPISEVSFAITEPDARNQNLYKWTGDAAGAYNAKSTKQKAAADEVVTKAEFISQWLFKIAKANVDYAVQLAKVVTDLAGKFVQAVVNGATIIDIPFAISTLAESAGNLVKEQMNTLLTIGQRFVDALGNVRDLATQVGDHSKLPGGRWPQAVSG
jgi:hypothetical protein